MRALARPRPASRGPGVPRSWDRRPHRYRARPSPSPPCQAWLRHWHRRHPPARLRLPPSQSHPTPPGARSLTSASSASAHPAASDETAMAEAASEPADVFDANDEAMLDMVAMEMAAPDSDAAYDPTIEEHQDHEMQVADAQALASVDGTISESVAAYEIEVTFPDSSETADEPVAATVLP